MTSEHDLLAEIRQQNEQRKASAQIGGVRAYFEVDFLLSQIDRLRSEKSGLQNEIDELQEFQNSIANRMPENYDGEEAQEAIIDRWLDDLTKPRTVTSAEELWDIPALSVISDCHGHVYQKFESDDNDAWLAGGELDSWIAEDILNNFAPVTVLRVGDSHV